VGPFQLQAAIAGVHGEAAKASDTDWQEIAGLYRELSRITRGPVVELNYAVAVAMSEGPERGLAMMDKLGESGELKGYYLFYAARADLLRRLRRLAEAGCAYERALSLATNQIERKYLERRLREVRA
jgi:RNA polymerase sigma-70 factor, ECF subfamily